MRNSRTSEGTVRSAERVVSDGAELEERPDLAVPSELPGVPLPGVATAALAALERDRDLEGGGRGSGFAPPRGGGESLRQPTGDFECMAEPFVFRERDVALWLGMPQNSLKTARPKNGAGVALIGGWVMYERAYLEGLLVQFGLAEKNAAGAVILIEGLAWGPLEELTRAWAVPARSEPAASGVRARVVRPLMNPFLFLAQVLEGAQTGERVNVTVKRKEERQRFRPGMEVQVEPLAGRPVWGVVKPQNTQNTQKAGPDAGTEAKA